MFRSAKPSHKFRFNDNSVFEDLSKAIQVAVSGKYDVDDVYAVNAAEETAGLVLGFFGHHDSIIDNLLLPKERDLFYQLETHGILRTSQEEAVLPDGRDWRIHWWSYKYEKIEEFLKIAEEQIAYVKQDEAGTVYDAIFSSIDYKKSRPDDEVIFDIRGQEVKQPQEDDADSVVVNIRPKSINKGVEREEKFVTKDAYHRKIKEKLNEEERELKEKALKKRQQLKFISFDDFLGSYF